MKTSAQIAQEEFTKNPAFNFRSLGLVSSTFGSRYAAKYVFKDGSKLELSSCVRGVQKATVTG